MVVVDLGYLLAGEHRAVDELQVVGEQRQRLEGEEIAEVLGLLGLDDKQQVLSADTVLAGLVQARLVAHYHAGQQLHVHQVGADALRPLVAAQEVADAVSRAVTVGHRLLPQRQACENVQLAARGAHGELGALQCQVTLENEGEVMLLLCRRVAQGDGAGDVGGAVQILAAAVHEQDALAMQGRCALVGGLIVHDGAVLLVTADHREAVLAVQVLLGAELLPLGPHVHLVDGATGGRLLNPLEQTHQGGAVALHGVAEAVDLHLVLDALEVGDGGAEVNLLAG